MMKTLLALGLCFPLAMAEALLTARSASAQQSFEACLNTADSLFIDNSQSELAAIQACKGTTQPEEVAECINFVDALWRDGSASELVGLEACQAQQRYPLTPSSSASGNYASCLLSARESTRDQSLEELASIRACSGLAKPEEVAACLSLAEYLWRDESEAEIAGLSSCQVALY
ncbi:MAG: hypothetical protein F6J95_020965 [Leptolyngbya sp. SIO1E4]|nr:hypothetical protein [Leptolyngbya sp. SIO1E4]